MSLAGLRRMYLGFTTIVGLVGVAIGIASSIWLTRVGASAMGLSLTKAMPFDHRALMFSISVAIGWPICIYLGCVVAALTLAAPMCWQGRITLRQYLLYAIASRYPMSWRR